MCFKIGFQVLFKVYFNSIFLNNEILFTIYFSSIEVDMFAYRPIHYFELIIHLKMVLMKQK